MEVLILFEKTVLKRAPSNQSNKPGLQVEFSFTKLSNISVSYAFLAYLPVMLRSLLGGVGKADLLLLLFISK